MRNPRQVAVVGVTGYTGLELARILLRHPELPPPAFYVREPNGVLPSSFLSSAPGAKRRSGPFLLMALLQATLAPRFLRLLTRFPRNWRRICSRQASASSI